MNWLQLEIRATSQAYAAVESAFLEAGAAAITLFGDGGEPILEPDPGETPIWQHVRLVGLFALDADMAVLRDALVGIAEAESENSEVDLTTLSVSFVGDKDWQDSVNTHALDEVFGDRLWVRPKPGETDSSSNACSANASPELATLYLDPGLAFGSGTHPTTHLCLQWIAQHIKRGQRVLDFGCGSGVLGIAAALLGARVIGVDHDAQAIMASNQNAAYNGLRQESFVALHSDDWSADTYVGTFDVVIANILAGALADLAEMIEGLCVPGGQVVLSGVLQPQADQLMGQYLNTDFHTVDESSGWVRLDGTVDDFPFG